MKEAIYIVWSHGDRARACCLSVLESCAMVVALKPGISMMHFGHLE